jgi:hypothetical protein
MKKLYDSLTWKQRWKNVVYISGTAAGIALFAYVIPFGGYTWMRREFTRSILSSFDLKSKMEVIGLTDDEIQSFKEKSPKDMIRMYAAPIEGYILFSNRMQHNIFFYNQEDFSFIPALITPFLALGDTGAGLLVSLGEDYMPSMAALINDGIQSAYDSDGDQLSRNLYARASFNWVYDLFRPNESYAARGTHPSGDGTVARYIRWSQLTDDEKNYLVTQGYLAYLNFVSPLLYGINSIPLGKTGFEMNFALNHYLTSFGADIPVRVYLKHNGEKPLNMAFTYHNYMNYKNYFFALEAELVDFPIRITPKFAILLSPRVLVGMQPKNQVFKTGSPEFFGLASCRADFAVTKHFLPYLEVTAKTDGWVAGNEYLGGNVSVTIGVSARF